MDADKLRKGRLFTANPHEENWKPTVIANNTIEISLSYTEHAVNLRPTHSKHVDKYDCQTPSAYLAHLEGVGLEKDRLMKAHKALQLSLITYEAPAWEPWADPSDTAHLERCQNKDC